MTTTQLNETKIIVENLHKTFLLGTNAVPALRGIDLEFKEHEFVGIMGPSGCGKTTLLNIIGGLDDPSRGTVYLEGDDLSKLTETEKAHLRRDKIGVVFQFYNLFPLLSAVENVMSPMLFQGLSKNEARTKALTLLDDVGLKDRADHAPSELSGGQQQRVAIARAFANDPTIVLLDEPTGDLDSKSAHEILELLRQLNQKGATFIVATHDPLVASYCSRIIHFKDGKIDDSNEMLTSSISSESSAQIPLSTKNPLEYVLMCQNRIYFLINQALMHSQTELSFESIKQNIEANILKNLPIPFEILLSEMIQKNQLLYTIKNNTLILKKYIES
ncbi:ABC transporter ATP-binding protein [Candidatus Lokiarchaeum ossiferum]|uniref:ABC transporter ATP-binding protein n=1 Tax=Candidatus Lokiarchaeum ossiferum TaxID=2951803 RepID=UPI00352D1BDD